MIRILRLGLISFLFVSGCNTSNPIERGRQIIFYDLIDLNMRHHSSDYASYCLNITEEVVSSEDIVMSSFFGDDERIMDAINTEQPAISSVIHNVDTNYILNNYRDLLNSNKISKKDSFEAVKLIEILSRPSDLKNLFSQYNQVSAKELIIERALKCDYLLVNEAHYSGQHRAFTKSLLKELSFQGYRYLALEALSYDSSIQINGYPTLESGYYIKETNFGNLVREALRLGYEIIPYETKSIGQQGTGRDLDQAMNILEKTQCALKGKVIVHAGYSHINKSGGSSYKPMGLQLQELSQKSILSVDQVVMSSLTKSKRGLNPYYRFVRETYEFDNPIIFIGNDRQSLVDPINATGIDLQVYHPANTLVNGRAKWRKSDLNYYVDLPQIIAAKSKSLLKVFNLKDGHDSIPIDQFIISEDRCLILPVGHFRIEVVNCDGSLTFSAKLKIT